MEQAGVTKALQKFAHEHGENAVPNAVLCYYSMQVVAGLNYKLVVDAADSLYEVRVYKPLPYTGEPARVMAIDLVG